MPEQFRFLGGFFGTLPRLFPMDHSRDSSMTELSSANLDWMIAPIYFLKESSKETAEDPWDLRIKTIDD